MTGGKVNLTLNRLTNYIMILLTWLKWIDNGPFTGFKLESKQSQDELRKWDKPIRVHFGTEKDRGEILAKGTYYQDYKSGEDFLNDPDLKITELTDTEANVIIRNIGLELNYYWYKFDHDGQLV